MSDSTSDLINRLRTQADLISEQWGTTNEEIMEEDGHPNDVDRAWFTMQDAADELDLMSRKLEVLDGLLAELKEVSGLNIAYTAEDLDRMISANLFKAENAHWAMIKERTEEGWRK